MRRASVPARARSAAIGSLGARPHRRELARRPGQHDDVGAAERQQQPGAVPSAITSRPRHERLLAIAVAVERRVGPAPARERGHDRRDRLEQPLVQHELGARDLRDGLDRAVVVRRPEPSRGDHQVVIEQLAQPGGDLVVLVTDDADARATRSRARPARAPGSAYWRLRRGRAGAPAR